MHGHYWTLRPLVEHALKPAIPPAEHWMADVNDELLGRVRISGRLQSDKGQKLKAAPHANRELLLVVHGLGGQAASHYVVAAARAAQESGVDCLRLNLRGADLRGDDFYHAGLTADLRAAVANLEHDRIYVLGYSLGGHIALRFAAEGVPSRVVSVAAVCAPLNLAAGAYEIDKPQRRPYLNHLLHGLRAMYRRCRHPQAMPISAAQADRIRTIRDWDDQIVAPRFGFASAEDYWARCSAGPVLQKITCPTLLVHAAADPMVLTRSVQPSLRGATHLTSIVTRRGGHVGFPRNIDLGLGSSGNVENQVLAWLRSASRGTT